ncbi:MAG: hypothetical protein C5B48_13495 [Candidatus Rokuibacteriota bacterium]|nr:MAG: hypothetical protein C5B48_13495 [Candidatus Rokubacteria bacterium]
MTEEAKLVETESGLEPEGQGWFVVNVRDAAWWSHREVFGLGCPFGSRDVALFPELGITLRVLQPGEPNCRYHAESTQEDFLVLSGECLVLVEGEERLLRAWDFVHCPGGTEHVFVGAGSGPCVILMTGARREEGEIVYPVSELALRHGAGVQTEASDPAEAYADLGSPRRERLPDLGLPWQKEA